MCSPPCRREPLLVSQQPTRLNKDACRSCNKILFASEWDCAKRLTFKIRTSENQIKTMTLELGQHRKERTKASLPEKRGRGG
jgi:hypothetical protein